MADQPTFDPGFTTPPMTAVFSDRRRVEAMLMFEAALARAEAAAGIIPGEAGDEIARACQGYTGDASAVVASTWEVGTPLTQLLDEVRSRISSQSAQWIHHGATSQDAIDTALMLQLKEALGILDEGVSAVARMLKDLAQAHRSTPVMARTFLQHAQPTTFGLRLARWLEPLLRHLEVTRETAGTLPVQLGGPVGDLGAFGEAGPAVVDDVAATLGLVAPVIAWHSDRSHVLRPVRVAEAIAASMGKVGSDLAVLAQSDVGEVGMRAGASSSMAHKRNPIDAMRAVAAAGACASAASGLQTGRHELERGVGGWHLEWWAVPLVFQTTAASVEGISRCLETLEVNVDIMKRRAGELDQATLEATSIQIERVLDAARGTL